MEFDEIQDVLERLIGVMDARKLDELEIEVEGLKVALRRGGRGGDSPAVVVAHAGAHPAVPMPAAPAAPGGTPAEGEGEGLHIVSSPMVGTFYRSPAPDADPFVDVGDEVTPDTVLCIIEAMKVMNELKAEVAGVVQAVRAEDREAVEYGQPLFVIARPSA